MVSFMSRYVDNNFWSVDHRFTVNAGIIHESRLSSRYTLSVSAISRITRKPFQTLICLYLSEISRYYATNIRENNTMVRKSLKHFEHNVEMTNVKVLLILLLQTQKERLWELKKESQYRKHFDQWQIILTTTVRNVWRSVRRICT